MIRNHPAVGEVRSIGTMAAVELRADDAGYFSKLRPKLYQFFLDAGVLLRPLGNVVYVLPPYTISPDELNYVHDRIAESLDLCKDSDPGAEGLTLRHVEGRRTLR